MTERTERSIVKVIFIDGEEKEYAMNAGLGLSSYLARESADAGVLTIWDAGRRATSIPVAQIREWEITPASCEHEQ